MPLRFSKMHGAGNDFVIVDRRATAASLPSAWVARMADRHRGIGFDQLITIEPPRSPDAVASYVIFNADGSPAGQCGNGARCVVAWLLREAVVESECLILDSPSGRISAQRETDGIGIDMGIPNFSPAAIGLDMPEADPYRFSFDDHWIDAGAVSMGNPHVVIEVADVASAEVARIGQQLQRHPSFRDSCNVGFAQVLDTGDIALRVYERGVGETLACGSGACAAFAVLARRGRVGDRLAVKLPGGTLQLSWQGTGYPIHMTGPAAFVFEGEFLA